MFLTMIEALRLKQKEAAPRSEPVLHAVVRYNPYFKEWDVSRYDESGVEMGHERHQLQGAARYIASTWMDMYNVTNVRVYQIDGKVKEIIEKGQKEAS